MSAPPTSDAPPLSDDIIEQIRFNNDVIARLRLLAESAPEETANGIRDTVDVIEYRNLVLQPTVTFRTLRMPCEMQCAAFDHMSNFELIDVIVTNSQFERSAGYCLQKRRLVLVDLSTGPEWRTPQAFRMTLTVKASPKMKDGADVITKKEEMRFASASSFSEYIAGVLYVVLTYFNVSESRIFFNALVVNGERSRIPLEDWLGAPPTEASKKIKIGCLAANSIEQLQLYRWISQTQNLYYRFTPEAVFDDDGQFMLNGLDQVTLHDMGQGGYNIDDFMARCQASTVRIDSVMNWTPGGFYAVLSAHANSGAAGVPREIECCCFDSKRGDLYIQWQKEQHPNAKTLEDWTQMYDKWLSSHVAVFGEPARKVTWAKGNINGFDIFVITLH